MDIIGAGDFVVTSAGGATMMSYRYPSLGVQDFVKEIEMENALRAARQGKKKGSAGPALLHQKTPPRGQRKKR